MQDHRQLNSIRIKAGALIIIAGTAFSLSACDHIPGTQANTIAKAKDQVAALMKDPSSVMFTEIQVSKDRYVCGFVNAKNSFGAYEGREGFMVDKDGKVTLETPTSSGNVGTDATNQCTFKEVHPACLKGEDVLTAQIRAARLCMGVGTETINKAYSIK